MKKTAAELSYDFLFAKLHGMWARSMKGEALDRLVHCGSLEALGRQLAPLGLDFSRREAFQRDLTALHIAEIAGIRWLLDEGTARFYEALLQRYLIENLKTVLHYYFSPDRDVPIELLLIDSPDLPAFDAAALLEARNIHQLFTRLPDPARRGEVLRLLVEIEDTRDLLAGECGLDRIFYADLLAASAAMPPSNRACAEVLVRMEIDFCNLIMVLRNAAIYHLPPETIQGLCIEGGRRLREERLRRIIAAPDARELLTRLPAEYQRILGPTVDAELYLAENALRNAHSRRAKRFFAEFDRPCCSIIAFPFLKRYEMLNIGRVFEGMHFGLEARLIDSMMIA